LLSQGYARPRYTKKRLTRLLITLLVILGGILLFRFEHQNVYDAYALFDYHPSTQVSSLATADTMTPYARHVYYVNHPKIDSKVAFASVCPNGTEQSVVLGCYHSNQRGIFLLQVTDPQLDGVEQVTAAHETLHAIYDRLSSAKRQQVDNWLLDYYNNGLVDPTVKAQIALYRQTEPHDVTNEMHSLFGTEIASLPPNLQNYYSQYFTNRQAVVNNYLSYNTAFTSRKQQVSGYDAQLSSLNDQINQNKAELSQQYSAIQVSQKTLETEKSNGQIDDYNAGVPVYNQEVDQYNALLTSTQSLINQYNQIVATRNSVALEEQQLVQQLSTSSQKPISQ
jgi:hypothetical protein